jgi:hypothetical protein
LNGIAFSGQFRPDGTVSLLKQYIGRHWVDYEGHNSGEGIFGTWHIPGFDSGRFALRPLAPGEIACDEIQELAPASKTSRLERAVFKRGKPVVHDGGRASAWNSEFDHHLRRWLGRRRSPASPGLLPGRFPRSRLMRIRGER